MRKHTFFTTSIILPLLVGLYAAEAGAQTVSVVRRAGDAYAKMADYTDVPTTPVTRSYNELGVTITFTFSPATSYSISLVECSVEHPDESPNFSTERCGTISGTGSSSGSHRQFSNLPVQQGLNEVQVRATIRNNTTGATHVSEPFSIWTGFLHTQNPPAPVAAQVIGIDTDTGRERVAAIPDANGNCNPVRVPLHVEHMAYPRYQIDGGPVVDGRLQNPPIQALPSSSLPPGYVDYVLELSDTALQAGRTLPVRVSHTDHLGRNIATPQSSQVDWIVECPQPVTASVEPPFPQSGYASKATLHFTASDGNAPLFCSLNGAEFEPCTSPLTYEGLQAGTQTFRVYAQPPTGTPSIVSSPSWDVLPPDVELQKLPPDSSSRFAFFQFAAVEGVDVPVSFKCRLDGGSFFECSSPFVARVDVVGPHSFEVLATSSVGEKKEEEASRHNWEMLAAVERDLSVEILEPLANSKLPRLEVAKGNVAPGDEVQGFLIRRGSDTGHVLSCSTEPTGHWTCLVPPGLELEAGDWQVLILASADNEAAASGSADFQIGETAEQAEAPISIGSGDCSGCSTAADLPLGLGVLALWWMSRRRDLKQT